MRYIYINGRDLTHETLAGAFSLPTHYGKNLDALYDCLTEIGTHTMIVLSNTEAAKENPIFAVICAAVAANDRLCLLLR